MACRPKEEQLTSDPVQLRFSEDTVLFDTLLSSVGSVTKRFKVYNDGDKAIETNVVLGEYSNSPYKIWVNGVEDYQHNNVLLFGKDSMLILVEVLIDPQDEDTPYLVKDSVVFQTNGVLQHVKLVSYGQDAHFLKDSTIACNTTWTAGKAYVLMGTVTVPMGCNLTIEPGTIVLGSYKSQLKVEGNITVSGTASLPVKFCNANDISQNPEKALGYWKGIEFTATSTGNTIDWAVIKNAERGLYLRAGNTVDSVFELSVDHSIIKNMSKSGVECYGADLNVFNSLVTNCASVLVGGYGGGNINLIHVTLANYGFDFFRTGPSFQCNTNAEDDGLTVANGLKVGIANSIIWGNRNNEVEVENATQFYTASTLFKSPNAISGAGNIFNQEPLFVDAANNNLQLTSSSPAIDQGVTEPTTPTDLNGVSRTAVPEMGAYEFIP